MTDLPDKPDPVSGTPRPPAAPTVSDPPSTASRPPGTSDAPPAGHGPPLEVRGSDWWMAPVSAFLLAAVTVIVLSFISSGWVSSPATWVVGVFVFLLTLLSETSVRIAAGAHWLRVNRRWVDTYEIADIHLRGVGFGWLLRLRDTRGRRVRVFLASLETNRQLWALVYNGMAHSTDGGARMNNLAAGLLRLQPGFELTAGDLRRPRVSRRFGRRLLIVLGAVCAVLYLVRPGQAGLLLAVLVLLALVTCVVALFRARARERAVDARGGMTETDG